MARGADYPGPEKALAAYEALLETIPEIERKGKTMPYTSYNGHMFTHLSAAGELGIRLPDDEREAFMTKHKAKPFVQHGAVMRGYVAVPAALLPKTKELAPYLATSYEYVQSLKPRESKRRPAAKKRSQAKGSKR